MIRYLFALAFLPADEIPVAFEDLKPCLAEEASHVITWFENNNVLEQIIGQLRNGGVLRAPLTYSPIMWSVDDSMQSGFPRTQNAVEAWHRRWEKRHWKSSYWSL